MEHADHVALLRGGVEGAGRVWAELGSGGGAFTLALAELLGEGAEIWSVDRDARALRRQQEEIEARFPGVTMHYVQADYTKPVELPPLDGVLMANALHFQRDWQKRVVLRQLYEQLKPGGRLLIVEYNTDRGNAWVPHPITFERLVRFATEAGFRDVRRLMTRPSQFLGEIYSAMAVKPTTSA